ncbi:MAG: LacI family DNA-binding transcriptional regulator [bacterium]|nr:LacI family DNA-binding transcriptional regulator [bacterium]
MTIREFAKLCNVSPATVSRYFSGAANLSPEIAKTIQEKAAAFAYTPSSRGKHSNSHFIFLFTPLWRHCFFNDMTALLQEKASSFSFQIAVFPSKWDNYEACSELLTRFSPAGAILFDELLDDPLARLLQKQQIPTVMCGSLSLDHLFPAVHIDDLSAAYEGTNYLIGLGHTHIGVISARLQTISSGYQRVMGARKALEDASLSLPEEHIVYCGSSFQDGYEGMNALFLRKLPLTAVFAFSDDMAAGAIVSIQEHGLSVPEDISVLAFDNSSAALECRPKLSTIGQPLELIAQRSLELLTDYPSVPETITLRHSLIQRDSCAPKKA